jgi:hypothetical protein
MVVGTRRTITGVENLMANADHLSLLKKGVKAWNQWRLEHEQVQADLSEADLSGADLFGADLSKANLSEADLTNRGKPNYCYFGRCKFREGESW